MVDSQKHMEMSWNNSVFQGGSQRERSSKNAKYTFSEDTTNVKEVLKIQDI